MDRRGMNEINLALARACEERIVNCWPAVETLLIGDFVVRLANGYSSRANSASPIREGATLSEADIAVVESIYRKAGLKPCFRSTPLMHPSMRETLALRGYRIKDQTVGMILPLNMPFAPSARCRITSAPERDWLSGVSALQGAEKSNADHFEAILRRLRVPAFFVSIEVEGQAIGFGYTAVDRGMADLGSIVLDPRMRGRGLGRDLVSTLLATAAQAEAHTAFLQVVESNIAAVNLYRSLGFRALYPYENLVREE